MRTGTISDKLKLLSETAEVLNKSGITYIVYGSLAFNILTGEDGPVNDIDIIVMQNEFSMINIILTHSSLKLLPHKSEFNIHANSTEFVNDKGEPFDISFDSYEHYFEGLGINILNSIEWETEGVLVRVIDKDSLLKVYSQGILGSNKNKITEYQRKIEVLKNK